MVMQMSEETKPSIHCPRCKSENVRRYGDPRCYCCSECGKIFPVSSEIVAGLEKKSKNTGCLLWCIACGVAALAYWLISLCVNAAGKSPADTQKIMSRFAVVLGALFVPWLIKVFKGEASVPDFGSKERKSCLRLILIALATLAVCAAVIILFALLISSCN